MGKASGPGPGVAVGPGEELGEGGGEALPDTVGGQPWALDATVEIIGVLDHSFFPFAPSGRDDAYPECCCLPLLLVFFSLAPKTSFSVMSTPQDHL